MIGLIMAGGSGTRFWPKSRKSFPKQYLNIISDDSMIQLTVKRLNKFIKMNDIFIVTSEEQRPLVLSQLKELPEDNIIVEPFGMNTAPCIALSALYLSQKYPSEEEMLVVPADHLIMDEKAFEESVRTAERVAKLNFMSTFGIKPTYPATGYGYIEAGKNIHKNIYEVTQFKEKPDLETAKEFLAAGNFYWNSGMFYWSIKTIIHQFKKYLPKVIDILSEIADLWDKEGKEADISELYKKMPRLPIDIGIMEQSDKRVIIPVDYGWSDVGSWKALYDVLEKDENENVIRADNITLDSQKNLVFSDKFVSLINVSNLVIVETDKSLLVADINSSERVKEIVVALEEQERIDIY